MKVEMEETSKVIFGARLQNLLAPDGSLPLFIERLITAIEVAGLYVEGIYRKSGANAKIKMLKAELSNDPEAVDFSAYPIHVLASTLKSFFREMPEPLMKFALYDHFIQATDIADLRERTQMIYDIARKLPRPNFLLLERLMFHLSRVAYHEPSNRMSPTNLAVVFAPCVLRPGMHKNAQESLMEVSKQTACLESIIREELRKYELTLEDINTLESATAVTQVSG